VANLALQWGGAPLSSLVTIGGSAWSNFTSITIAPMAKLQ